MATKRTRATQSRPVRILISESGIDVDPRCGELRYGGNEQIEWLIYPTDLDFTVKFDKETGSPFRGKRFTRKRKRSGPPKVNPGKNDKYYAYSLEVEGFEPIDPGIIIWRR